MEIKEIWKDVKGYEGLYQVSSLGRIKSLRNYSGVHKKYYKYEKIMRPVDNGKGYLAIMLSKNKIKKHKYIHRLVAETFIPNPNKLPEVNHKDENKQNNNVDNLEWCTKKYNNCYGTKNKRGAKARGKAVLQININTNEIINTFDSMHEAARKTDISQGNIWSCCNGKYKSIGGYKWRYQMKYIISNNIRIQNPTEEMKDYVEENLVIENPQYNQLKRLGKWTGNISRYLVWYEIDGNDLIVPFGFIDMLWKVDRDIEHYENRINLGKRLTYKSKIKLFDYQEEVVKNAINKKNGRHNNASRFWQDTDSTRTYCKARI